MDINILTFKLIILLFPGMIGLITLRFCLYEKDSIKIPEFILYSFIFSLMSYLFQFNKLLDFLNDTTAFKLSLNTLIIGCIICFLVGLSLAHLINNGLIFKLLRLTHTGKIPLVENIYLQEKYLTFLGYYAEIRTENLLYIGSIETINTNKDLVEFFISECTLYKIYDNANAQKIEDFKSTFIALKADTFSISFYTDED